MIVLLGRGSPGVPTVTQNGASATCAELDGGSVQENYLYYCYLAAPTTGTFSLTMNSSNQFFYVVMTLKDAAQTTPIDAITYAGYGSTHSSMTSSTSTSVGNDLLLSIADNGVTGTFTTFGSGETEVYKSTNCTPLPCAGSWKAAASTASTESMTVNSNSTTFGDFGFIAAKGVSSGGTPTSNTYTYGGTGYANPDAPTQIANGVSTTTFSYDADGNVTQKTVDGTITTYVWDYANRLTALGVGGATTTYGYDWAGNRASQTGTSTTWIYPFKWVSLASSTGSGAQFATTTDYVFNGDSLVATIDQQTASGNATGTAKTRYIHPDHLGSTNVVTDESGNVSQTLDYYPYGGTRLTSTSGNYSGAGRQYVNRFTDQSSLDYLNARYYDPSRGQFLTEDPTFWSTKQNLSNPQSLNSYSYADDNPISKSDPNGLSAKTALAGLLTQLASTLQAILYQISQPQFVQSYQAAQTATRVAQGVAQNPSAAASNVWNAGQSYVSTTYNAFKTIGRSDSGDYLLGRRAADVLPFFFGPLGAEGDAAQLGLRAREINGMLDPIAASMRTTAVLRTTTGDIVAGGGKDLTKAQIASLTIGETAANPVPGTHAEIKAIQTAISNGSTPQAIGVSRPICAECQAYIRSQGGTMIDPYTASW
jgi:RHS repeat-associated protein